MSVDLNERNKVITDESDVTVVQTSGANGTNGSDGADGADGAGVPAGGTAGQVLSKIDSDDHNTEWSDPAGGGGALDYILVADKKTNANGGTSVAGYQVRTLTTIVVDTGSHASLSSNQVTLPAGTWRFRALAPCIKGNAHFLDLYNATDAAQVDDSQGSNSYALSSLQMATHAFTSGRFILAASKAIELRHFIFTGLTTTGLGDWNGAGGSSDDIFAMLEFWKEA